MNTAIIIGLGSDVGRELAARFTAEGWAVKGTHRKTPPAKFDSTPCDLATADSYPVAKLRELQLYSTRFSIVAEINVRLLRQGCSFAEVPAERQNGVQRSSVTLRNLADTGRVLLCLLVDVYLRERGKYARRPVRVRA